MARGHWLQASTKTSRNGTRTACITRRWRSAAAPHPARLRPRARPRRTGERRGLPYLHRRPADRGGRAGRDREPALRAQCDRAMAAVKGEGPGLPIGRLESRRSRQPRRRQCAESPAGPPPTQWDVGAVRRIIQRGSSPPTPLRAESAFMVCANLQKEMGAMKRNGCKHCGSTEIYCKEVCWPLLPIGPRMFGRSSSMPASADELPFRLFDALSPPALTPGGRVMRRLQLGRQTGRCCRYVLSLELVLPHRVLAPFHPRGPF